MTGNQATSKVEALAVQQVPLTRAMSEHVVNSRWDTIPDTMRHEALRSLVTWVGCTVGGSQHETVRIALEAIRRIGGQGPAAVFGRSERLTPQDATLVNGISSAVLDYDATQAKLTNIHASGPVAPALFAVAAMRPVSGSDLIHAYVLGIEIACRLANHLFGRDNPGWHVTGACGGIGAAVAVGKVLNLDAPRMAAAIGIAATQAGGLREMYGTMCKSFTPGRSGQNGLLAAVLAEDGFTSADAAIEGGAAFARVLTGRDADPRMLDGFGQSFEVMANTYKPFPCAIVTHAVIDGCLGLRRDHALSHEDVERIALTVAPIAVKLANEANPRTGLESKFSVQHTAAMALVYGHVGHRLFVDDVARDPKLAALRALVRVQVDPAMAKDQAVVSLYMRDGGILTRRVEHALGGLKNPMSDDDLERKFLDLTLDILPDQQARNLLDRCWQSCDLPDVALLLDAAVLRDGTHG